MSAKTIPDRVQKQITDRIAEFNKQNSKDSRYYYTGRFKGNCLYLDRVDNGVVSQICRLTYKGNINKWDFAIFKYSSERYDPHEWMFPGSEYVDGTVEGAMKAGLHAY